MKMLFIPLMALVCTTSVAPQGRNFQHLVGKWEAVDAENQSGSLEFIDSVQIFLVYGTEKKPVAICTMPLKRPVLM